MRTAIRLALVSLLLSIFIPHATLASCLYQTPEQLLESADVVVEAEVTDVVMSPQSTTVVADVQKIIKGEVGDTVSFITGSGSQVVTSVDVFFEVGATYKLYLLLDEEGLLTTTSCAGTYDLAANSGLSDDGDGDIQPIMNTVDYNDSKPVMPWVISGIIAAICIVSIAGIALRDHGSKS